MLAAAIAARADVIVTNNLAHFPAQVLAAHQIEVQMPDEFLLHQFTLAPVVVTAAAQAVRARLHRPPQSADDFLHALDRANLPRFALPLAAYKDKL